jgi:PAS domain S-box-containing protein
MKKLPDNHTEAKILRSKAEKQLKKKRSNVRLLSSESDIIKLNNELSVHQIELEMQNEELIKTKQELETAVEKYVELYDFAPSGYLTISRNGQILRLNLTAAKLLGYDRRNLINRKLENFINPDSKPVLSLFLSDIYRNQIEGSCEVALVSKKNLPVYVYLIGLLSNDGETCEISMVDITERELAEEKLKSTLNDLIVANTIKKEHEKELMKVNKELERAIQSNNDANRLISILAHDLRSPFSVIMGFSELLSENLHQFNPDEIENLVSEINKSTQVTFNLLEDLLKWARMQSGRIPFKPQKLIFKDIWVEIDKILAPAYCAKNVTISYSVPGEIEVIADSVMLKAILRNLISNAIKYSLPGGLIKVTAEHTVSSTIFTISDNGIGIEADYLSKLFDLSELHPTPGTSGEFGLGLGLFLCKGFVEKHGGKIWAESKFGKGSLFYFTIPVNAKPIDEYVSLKSIKEKKAYNLKILVADDNESLRIILGEILKKYSREILFARTGSEAVDIFKKNPDIDLIFMDFFMPEMNGYEATRQIRILNKDVTVFVETSDTLSDINEEFAGVKINDFFPKPYNKLFLNELIEKHFSKTKKGM